MQGIENYLENSATGDLEELVRKHTGLVMKIAKNLKRKLPSNIEFDDLVQAGFVGLIEASKTFRDDQGATFETFASIRVKGSILDDLRKNSVNNRDILKKMKDMGHAVHRVEQRTMRAATAEEVAKELNIDMEEYDLICQYININNMASMDSDIDSNRVASEMTSPEDTLLHEDLKATIRLILETLPERERILLSLYYIEELTFKEISEVLELTEARVCQIHAASIASISKKLKAT